MLYSRTSGFCPECKTELPKELQLSADEKQHQVLEREKFKLMVGDLQDKSKKKGLLRRIIG